MANGDGPYIITNSLLKIPQGSGDIMKEPMWTFDVDYVTQNNSTYNCLQRYACFLSLYKLNIRSFIWHKRFMKLHDFWGLKLSLSLPYQKLTEYCKES